MCIALLEVFIMSIGNNTPQRILFCVDDRLLELHELMSKVEHGRQGQVVNSFLKSSQTYLLFSYL